LLSGGLPIFYKSVLLTGEVGAHILNVLFCHLGDVNEELTHSDLVFGELNERVLDVADVEHSLWQSFDNFCRDFTRVLLKYSLTPLD
jgi:hypothetical protein